MPPKVDFVKLDKSCNSAEDGYAKEILKQMHDDFVEVYDTDYLNNGNHEFVQLPAVIKGQNKPHRSWDCYTRPGIIWRGLGHFLFDSDRCHRSKR